MTPKKGSAGLDIEILPIPKRSTSRNHSVSKKSSSTTSSPVLQRTISTEVHGKDYERYKMRLEAESLVATAAALFAGLAMAILDNQDNFHDQSGSVESTYSQDHTFYFGHQRKDIILYSKWCRMAMLSFTAVANLFVLTIATTTFFVGTRILAKSKQTNKELNSSFNHFWDRFSKSRHLSRNLFMITPPIFMCGVSLGLFSNMPVELFVILVVLSVGATLRGTRTALCMLGSIQPKNKATPFWDVINLFSSIGPNDSHPRKRNQ